MRSSICQGEEDDRGVDFSSSSGTSIRSGSAGIRVRFGEPDCASAGRLYRNDTTFEQQNLIDVQVIVDRIREIWKAAMNFDHRTTPILDIANQVVAQTGSEQKAESKVALPVRSKGVQRN